MTQQTVLRPYPISGLCRVFGYSRQAYYKVAETDIMHRHEIRQRAVAKLLEVRRIRPSAGCRYVYREMEPEWPLGRDRTERLLLGMGYAVPRPNNVIRTTRPGGKVYPNLILDMSVDNVNQVWQSDMTYFYTEDGKVNYLIFITDVYSQYIIGHGAYRQYPAMVFVEVLQGAFRGRRHKCLKGLIHHSDRGAQYGSRLYVNALATKGILSSMCKYSWANPYAEKTNDLIKNGYLTSWNPSGLRQLRSMLTKAVRNHNQYQRKQELNWVSPVQYEELIEKDPSLRRRINLKPHRED